MDEAGLIIQAQRGDPEAFRLLIEPHQERIFRLAYLLLGDAAAAEDAAQETFIQAFRALPRFDSARPLRPWLLRIVTNRCYNTHRAAKRYLAALRRTLFAGEAAPPIDLHDSQALHTAIARLPRPDQEVIYMRFFLDLSVDETAAVLAVAPGTVKSRLSRALARLRPLVADDFQPLSVEETHDSTPTR